MSELVEVKFNAPKELSECTDALLALVSDIKAKMPLEEIVKDVLPKLIVAIEGADKVKDELKEPETFDLVGYFAGDLVKVILK